MNCNLAQSLFDDYVDDLLPEEECNALSRHIETCEHCRKQLEQQQQMINLLASMRQPAPDRLLNDILNKIPPKSSTSKKIIRFLPAAKFAGAIAAGIILLLVVRNPSVTDLTRFFIEVPTNTTDNADLLTPTVNPPSHLASQEINGIDEQRADDVLPETTTDTFAHTATDTPKQAVAHPPSNKPTKTLQPEYSDTAAPTAKIQSPPEDYGYAHKTEVQTDDSQHSHIERSGQESSPLRATPFAPTATPSIPTTAPTATPSTTFSASHEASSKHEKLPQATSMAKSFSAEVIEDIHNDTIEETEEAEETEETGVYGFNGFTWTGEADSGRVTAPVPESAPAPSLSIGGGGGSSSSGSASNLGDVYSSRPAGGAADVSSNAGSSDEKATERERKVSALWEKYYALERDGASKEQLDKILEEIKALETEEQTE